LSQKNNVINTRQEESQDADPTLPYHNFFLGR
jgi:hypothetical protein